MIELFLTFYILILFVFAPWLSFKVIPFSSPVLTFIKNMLDGLIIINQEMLI